MNAFPGNEIAIAAPDVSVEGVSLTIGAEAARDFALSSAAKVQTVQDETDQKNAAAALQLLKRIQKEIEASREAVKKPFWNIGKQIDQVAKNFSADIAPEMSRLNGLIIGYQREQIEKIERQRKFEEQMALAKRRKAEQEAREAEVEARRLGEIAAATGDAMQSVLIESEAEAAERRAEAAKATAAEPIVVAARSVAQAEGVSTRSVWTFEVLDLPTLYAARPELCRLEVSTSAINAAIREGKERHIPGLRIFEDLKNTVRA